MSNQIAKPDADLKAIEQKIALPDAVKLQVGFFYAFHSDLLKGKLSLVSRLRFWMKEPGATADEIIQAMRQCMTPEACGSYQFGGQMLADLAHRVNAIVKKRKSLEQVLAMRKDSKPTTKPEHRGLAPAVFDPSNIILTIHDPQAEPTKPAS